MWAAARPAPHARTRGPHGACCAMAQLLAGARLVTKDGSTAPASTLEDKVVLLYFSASWCTRARCHRFAVWSASPAASGSNQLCRAPVSRLQGGTNLVGCRGAGGPCHRFTPILADFYEELQGQGCNVVRHLCLCLVDIAVPARFLFSQPLLPAAALQEICYVPGDRSTEEFRRYFSELHGDWLALDPACEGGRIATLHELYGVRGIPSLVVVQGDGTVIDASARAQVESHGPAAFHKWRAAWHGPALPGGAGRRLGGEGQQQQQQQLDEDARLAAALAASLGTSGMGSSAIVRPEHGSGTDGSAGAPLARERSVAERERERAVSIFHAARFD
jgi:hypothetical protein